MEIYKENTHKCSKSHKKCASCIQSYSCKKCRGICIFTKAALQKYPESRSFRKMVKERYYKREFEVLRSLEVSFSEPIDPVLYFDEDYDSDEEEENKVQRNEVYELLQKFQQLNKEQKSLVFKNHCTFYSYSKPWDITPLLKTNKGNKIVSLHHHWPNQKDRTSSRQEKIRDSIHYGSNIYLVD